MTFGSVSNHLISHRTWYAHVDASDDNANHKEIKSDSFLNSSSFSTWACLFKLKFSKRFLTWLATWLNQTADWYRVRNYEDEKWGRRLIKFEGIRTNYIQRWNCSQFDRIKLLWLLVVKIICCAPVSEKWSKLVLHSSSNVW